MRSEIVPESVVVGKDLSCERTDLPLCVDLDGTLIKTDTLLESVLALLKNNIALIIVLPFWLIKGRAYFKQQLFKHQQLDVAPLPYNTELLSYLKEERQNQRSLVLVTAADLAVAKSVADHLGIFSEVIASDGQRNLRGKHKADVLNERFGSKGYDYAANAPIDLNIWCHAAHSIIVGGSKRLITNASKVSSVVKVIPPTANRLLAILSTLRIHQWAKNTLIFIPLITSHNVTDAGLVVRTIEAFASFSFCASAAYVINDLIDLDADRHHSTKKLRKLASGDLPLRSAFWLIPLLLALSGVIALQLPLDFFYVLAFYFTLTIAYSVYFKNIVLADVLLLGGLYTIRIFAGAIVIGVTVSPWLLSFSGFLFLSLALLKRFSELRSLDLGNKASIPGRGYLRGDVEFVANTGAVSGYISVLVLALYINSREVTLLYTHPKLLWLICPAILYWISHVWLLAHRDEMHEDPVIFALKDAKCYALGFLVGAIMFLAT